MGVAKSSEAVVCEWDLIILCGGDASIGACFSTLLSSRSFRRKLSGPFLHLPSCGDLPLRRVLLEAANKNAKSILVLTLPHDPEHFISPVSTFLAHLDDQDSLVSLVDLVLDSLPSLSSSSSSSSPRGEAERGGGLWVCPLDAVILADPTSIRIETAPSVVVFTGQVLPPGRETDIKQVYFYKRAKSIVRFSATRAKGGEGLGQNGLEKRACAVVMLSLAFCERVVKNGEIPDELSMWEILNEENMAKWFKGLPPARVVETKDVHVLIPKTPMQLQWLCSHSLDKLEKLASILNYHPPTIDQADLQNTLFNAQRRDSASTASTDAAADRAARYERPSQSLSSVSSKFSISSAHSRVRSRTHSMHNEDHIELASTASVINSLLLGRGLVGSNCVIQNCKFNGTWTVSDGSICLGLKTVGKDIFVPPGVLLQELPLDTSDAAYASALVLYSVTDQLDLASSLGGTYLGMPWVEFFAMSGINADELWPEHLPPHQRTLRNATLFPVYIQQVVDRHLWHLVTVFLCKVLGRVRLKRASSSATSMQMNRAQDVTVNEEEERIHVPPALHFLARKAWRELPRASLNDLHLWRSIPKEYRWSRYLSFRIDEFRIAGWILDDVDDLFSVSMALFHRMAQSRFWEIFNFLDTFALSTKLDPGVIARILRTQAQALQAFADALHPSAATAVDTNLLSKVTQRLEATKADSSFPILQVVEEICEFRRLHFASMKGTPLQQQSEQLVSLARAYELCATRVEHL